MLLNVAILGVVFLIVFLASLGSFVVAYNHEGNLWQLIFSILMYVSMGGMTICFVAAIVLMIVRGFDDNLYLR